MITLYDFNFHKNKHEIFYVNERDYQIIDNIYIRYKNSFYIIIETRQRNFSPIEYYIIKYNEYIEYIKLIKRYYYRFKSYNVPESLNRIRLFRLEMLINMINVDGYYISLYNSNEKKKDNHRLRLDVIKLFEIKLSNLKKRLL